MKNKIKLFLKKNGFLTLLFLCVCFVAGATLFLATRDLGTGSDDLEIVEETDLEDADLDDLKDEENIEEEIESTVATNEGKPAEIDEDQVEEEPVEQEEAVEPESTDNEELEFIESEPIVSNDMMYPVEGEIITEFTGEGLIYSETLDDYRTHLGIDIRADINTTVKAPLGGTVKSVYEDELWGKVIIIDHGNGLESKLANLGTTEMVKEGLEVTKGDHIATVGNSAKVEMLMEDHLHFELLKDGKNIDPRSILH